MYKSGNYDVRNKIVELNIDLVKMIAKNYSYNCDVEYDDLFQEGCIALIKAIDDHDLSYDSKFSSYAYKCIVEKLKNYINENKFGYVLSRETIYKINKYRRLKCNGLSNDEIAKSMNFSIKQLDYFINKYSNFGNPLSLDSTANNCDNATLMDLCEGEDYISEVIDNMNRKKLRKELKEKIKLLLTKKQYQVIYLMFGFDERDCLNNDEIAKITGNTRQNINKIKMSAIMKLSMHDSIRKYYETM